MKPCCPNCGVTDIKKNGHIHNGKQNFRCKPCGRQFVHDPQKKVVSDDEKEQIKRLLLEKIPLRGICRVMKVSLTWLLGFMVALYAAMPKDLNYRPIQVKRKGRVFIYQLEAEADEMWSFVGKKENKQWIWLAIDADSRQILAFYVGDRSENSAKKLWERIPGDFKEKAVFYTDCWEAYQKVIPTDQHHAVAKGSGKTNIIERFNLTMRQRISRLVRDTLSFSKKLKNHINAIRYFICHYNTALHV